MAAQLKVWNVGLGFASTRAAWQARSQAIGCKMCVSLGETSVSGTYGGLDADGALLLNVAGGTQRILYGDVMFPTTDPPRPTTKS